MKYMYKIAVLGDRDSVFGFSCLGIDVFFAQNATEGEEILKTLTQNKYGIIYITEELEELMRDSVEKFQFSSIPAIIPIPGIRGNTGYGMSHLQTAVKKAVGSNILK